MPLNLLQEDAPSDPPTVYYHQVAENKLECGQDTFDFYEKSIGDPDKEIASIHAISPAHHIDAIKIPILLTHGDFSCNASKVMWSAVGTFLWNNVGKS